MGLEGKVAVVYSGARGIGKAYCEALVQNGCKVYFGDILLQEGNDTENELKTKNKDSVIVFKKCDVLIQDEIKELMAAAIAAEGHVDIVIANTGVIDEINWERCLDLNLRSTMQVFYSAMEHMSTKNGGKGGDFVATASLAGLKPFAPIPAYTATKYGIVGFIRSWGTADNYLVTGVRCNAICPHFINTKIYETLAHDQFYLEEQAQSFFQATQKNRDDGLFISPDAVGKGLIAMLEDKATNGQCVEVHVKGHSLATFV